MYIYLISNKNNPKEIYIGKSSNPKARFYSHISGVARGLHSKKYDWMREVGAKNLLFEIILEYDDTDPIDYEKQYIEKYRENGYKLFNSQLNDYHTDISKQNRFKEREAVWELYSTTDLSRAEICNKFGISDSLVSKIIQEHGGSTRKGKLSEHYEDIQRKIMEGVPIRQLAREYGVARNSISNINKGTTGFNPNLEYPLNKNVREQIMRDSWFKSKV